MNPGLVATASVFLAVGFSFRESAGKAHGEKSVHRGYPYHPAQINRPYAHVFLVIGGAVLVLSVSNPKIDRMLGYRSATIGVRIRGKTVNAPWRL